MDAHPPELKVSSPADAKTPRRSALMRGHVKRGEVRSGEEGRAEQRELEKDRLMS